MQLLPVMEAFYTLQGEGACQGQAAFFIRLGGCDVGCHWCDVKESWDAEAHPKRSVTSLVEEASSHPGRLVVITGGEPLMHPLDGLTAALQQAGFRTNIETSGAHPLSGYWSWFCLSPKKFKAPLPEVYPHADELKIIIYNKSDFKWAEEHAARVRPDCRLYLQPEWSRMEEMLPLMVDYIKANPRWQISLQVHKFMNIP
jgi:7-carboxy-7-deazaguanine synthase